MKSLMVLCLALGVGASAWASGFRCSEESVEGYDVYLKNKSAAASRLPELLRIWSGGELLVERKDEQIEKSNRNNVVQYRVNGNDKLGYRKAILQIHFKEGRETLEPGESAQGELVLYTNSSQERDVRSLECVRWRTNN